MGQAARVIVGILVVGAMLVVCLLAALLNPGIGVLLLVLGVLGSIYAFRSAAGRRRRARRRKR